MARLRALVVLVHQLEVRVLVPGLATEGVQDFQGSPHQWLGLLPSGEWPVAE